jgi:hypothetical protein
MNYSNKVIKNDSDVSTLDVRARIVLKIGVMLTSLLSVTLVNATEKEDNWYGSLWPIGERVYVEALKDTYVPFKTVDQLPVRPKLMLELGDPFLDTGRLDEGFTVPIIGAVWQPRFWAYMIYRTALQNFDSGAPGAVQEFEWANRLDLFGNLQLTGTEKILVGLRPVDNNQSTRFTSYSFNGANEGFNNEFNLDIETLFFEGDLGSLFPNLDKAGIKPIDYGFTVGRQPITFQEGILINDTVDAIGLVRNNLVFPGTSNLRISGMWAWNRLDRNDQALNSNPNMYGLFTAIDADVSTFNLDLIYVDDDDINGDGFYIGASAIQRLKAFGGISTAFRINSSIALDNKIAGNVIGDGTLLTAEFSSVVHGSDDIAYVNPFLAIGNYTQAGRESVVGGPLANTGILFASPNIANYGAEINPFTNDVVGVATGYQAFWDNHRRNLVLEVAVKHDYNGDDFNSYGVGFQLQQAVGEHVQLQLESFYVINSEVDDTSGSRFEVLIVY